MAQHKFIATKTRSSRPGWSVNFKHPLIRDARGEFGLKVRRGLNTRDEFEAERLVGQINDLLADPRWWTLDRKDEARKLYDEVSVSAFYLGVEPGRSTSRELRNGVVPLPSRDEGYARVMLVGSTGAGKTTLLRQFIGSHPSRDRFPSTSTARTTTADIEIVLSDANYKAVVTFMTEHETRCNVDECIEAACINAIRGSDDAGIALALLEHQEQRFRLSYPLGKWQESGVEPEDEDQYEMDYGNEIEEPGHLGDDEVVTDDEIASNGESLRDYVWRIKNLAETVREWTSNDQGHDFNDAKTANKQQEWLEAFVDELYASDVFGEISLDIMDDIRRRFEQIEVGKFKYQASNGWPVLWHYEDELRDQFLKQVRWFSSNHDRQFGRLLTPFVDGIRVRGPYAPSRPELRDPGRRLVFLDGEGLGHSAKEATSISTKVTEKFHDTDMVLLVDSAQSPMQAAPLELLRAVGSGGHGHKLAVAFTHFDQVRGDNLKSFKQKRDHVRGSIVNALSSLRDTVGAPVADILEKRLLAHDYYLGALDRPSDKIPSRDIGEMRDLMTGMQNSAVRPEPVDLGPMYKTARLELGLRDAADGFKNPWRGRLGLSYYEGVAKQHWGRIKALSRRIANRWDNDEYVDLKPKADLVSALQLTVSRWLDNPSGWAREPESDDKARAATNEIKQKVYQKIHVLAEDRLVVNHIGDWRVAFAYRGTGSSFERAKVMGHIYDEAAPSVSSRMDPHSQAFLAQVMTIVRDAVHEANGSLDES